MKNNISTIWQELLKVFRKSFGQIFAIHLSYIAFGVILFTPLAGIVGQFLLALSGQSVLSDLDIAYFFVTPTGIVAVILFATLMITILVFEQATLMAVCLAAFQDKNVKIMSTLYFTVRRAKNIFLFALHLVMRVLLITLPFLAISGAVAWFLVTDYDINYYLAAKPPVFIVAATAIGFLLACSSLWQEQRAYTGTQTGVTFHFRNLGTCSIPSQYGCTRYDSIFGFSTGAFVPGFNHLACSRTWRACNLVDTD